MIAKDWLYHQYIELGKSARQISNETIFLQYKILQKIKEFGIKRNYQDKEWLEHQYIELGKTPIQIAKEYPTKITSQTILKNLRKNNIPLKTKRHFKNNKYKDKIWLEHQYIELKKSVKQIANELVVSPLTIYKWLKILKIRLRKADPRSKSAESKSLYDKNKPIKKSNKKGYVFIYKPKHSRNLAGYVPEHQLVIEKEMGRYLNTHETVHHTNGEKFNNKIENLCLISNGKKHAKIHSQLRKISYQLVKLKIIHFDKKRKKYYLNLSKISKQTRLSDF